MENPLSADEARAALAVANAQGARLRQADRKFRWILILIAAVYLIASAIFSLVGRRSGSNLVWLPVVVVLIAGIAGVAFVCLRMRAYSRAGTIWFFVSVATFNVWDTMVNGVSIATRFWAVGQPDYHLFVSEAVGVIPLIVAAWLIGRR